MNDRVLVVVMLFLIGRGQGYDVIGCPMRVDLARIFILTVG